MIEGSERVRIEIKRTEYVRRDVAEHVAAAFLDWLDSEGFELEPKAGIQGTRARGDLKDLGYTELAAKFMEEWS